MRSILQSAALSVLVFLTTFQSAHAINIAIIDTGLDPVILGGVIEPGGFDFFNNDEDPSDESSNFHGTAVGHVAINSGSNIRLVPVKAFQESCCTTNDIVEAAFNHVATLDDVRVVNYSGASLTDIPVSTLVNVAETGKIIVLQAGNFGGASPAGDAAKVASLGGKGIVAGGVTPDGLDIQDFSNRAGDLQDHFLLAQTNSLLTSSNGTSMATPRVSAAAATILDAFGFLEPEQVVQLLFNTATDLGEPGADEIFGQGVLNLPAALSAAGAGNIPEAPSSGGGGGGSGIGIAALAVGGVVAYTLLNKEEELQRTVLVDAYGRAFTFGLADRITVRDTKPDIFSLQHSQRADFTTVNLGQSDNNYTNAYVADQVISPYSRTVNDELKDTLVSVVHRSFAPDHDYAIALNSGLTSDFGALSLHQKDRTKAPARFTSNNIFSTPVLGYSDQGSSFSYGWNNGSGHNHRLGFSVIDEQSENGQVSNSVLYESAVKRDRYRVGLQLGALLENGSLLGGASDSALGVDHTNTYYLGLNGSFELTNDITVIGGYFQGLSSIDPRKGGLLSDFSNIRSEGYAVGLLVDNFISERGSFGISYSSPIQTISGSSTLTLPVSQNRENGDIGFESSNISFADGDQEKVIEAYYDFQLNPRNRLFTHLSYTKNPLSDLDQSRERTIYFGWKYNF